MATINVKGLNNIGSSLKNATADLLSSSDFISRTIGMNNSYEDLMFIVQSLGREPISLLGKDYSFIFDHVRRNYLQGTEVEATSYGGNGRDTCPKFTFYKEKPTVRFANPYDDPKNLKDTWTPDASFERNIVANLIYSYAESFDGIVTDKQIVEQYDNEYANAGVNKGGIASFGNVETCDMIKKTNDNFHFGKYKTLVARFHTNSDDSKSNTDITQTANTEKYGMSHGRNLLKLSPTQHQGYDNPYCRVWTYYHQYNQISRAIRPFGDALTKETLESLEKSGDDDTVGFRTMGDKSSGFNGGSKRLDENGVLNYRNGMVNIAPKAKIVDYFHHFQDDTEKQTVSTKRCMFSIENLAWKDVKVKNDEFDPYGLSAEQRGPLGGRIMWFPPYDLKFSEDVSSNWNKNSFIGRGEDVLTYVNTERRGQLSFTLLIDHPAILDYWTGHKRNGMKNQGVPLAEGNSGGVDNQLNQENTLLRFFAGCEILSAVPQKYMYRTTPPQKPNEPIEEPKKVKNENPPEPEKADPIPKKICAILYYPNNYSGKDDRSGVVEPVWYLMNGVGAQKYVDPNTLMPKDIPTMIHVAPSGNAGYEMRSGSKGISQVTDKIAENYDSIKKTYADATSSERKAQYLSEPNGDAVTINYGNTSYKLAKIVGSKAQSMGAASNGKGGVSTNVTGASHLWYRKRYYYRCDKAYENQDFSNPLSYIDRESYGLNGSGFASIRRHSNVIKSFGLEDDSDTYRLISFTDLFVAMEGGDKIAVSSISDDNVQLVRDVLTNKDRYETVKIEFDGHASYQGRSSSNNDLAYNRALTIKNWLMGFTSINGIEMSEPKVKNQPKSNQINVGNLDQELVKIWRSASVVISYLDKGEEDAATAEPTRIDEESKLIQTNKVEIANKETSFNIERQSALMNHSVEIMKVKNGQYVMPSMTVNPTSDFDADSKAAEMNSILDATRAERDKKSVETESWNNIVPRYDNEGEFFEALDKDAPFLHHLITEKIKYFDPAFHSISPEGFNARLTFLHQCTRQGSTVENNAYDASTAYNLSFGRPPVCVLRIGDFYYTKIVINSLNIQYETPQWDLNPEGIGVMPMFANISLGFTFLGGSDLGGPIARLQNAVSFNYYANTSVYDNRAEMVQYDNEGKGNEVKFKGFTYPSENSSKGG